MTSSLSKESGVFFSHAAPLPPTSPAWRRWAAPSRAASRRRRSSCARRSGSSPRALCRRADSSASSRRPQLGMLPLEPLRERLGEGFGLLVSRRGVERHVNLQPFRAGGFRERLQAPAIEELLQPKPDLAALQDVRRRAGIEIEGDRRSAARSAGARCRNVCSSRSARFATQTSAARSFITQ